MACVIKARHRLAGNTIGLLPSAHLLKATTFGRNFDIWIIYNLKLAAQFWRNYRVENCVGMPSFTTKSIGCPSSGGIL